MYEFDDTEDEDEFGWSSSLNSSLLALDGPHNCDVAASESQGHSIRRVEAPKHRKRTLENADRSTQPPSLPAPSLQVSVSFGGSEPLSNLALNDPQTNDESQEASAVSKPFGVNANFDPLRESGISSTLEDALHTFIFKRMSPGQRVTSSSFWTHELYRGSLNEPVAIHYCSTRRDSEAIAQRFANAAVLGFDMEWKAFQCRRKDCKKTNCHGLQSKVSLIQLATESEIGLFHLGQHQGSTANEILAPTLRNIIESENIIKTGVAINSADGNRLRRFLRLTPRGLVELSDLHKLVKFWPWNKELAYAEFLVSLANLVKEHLGLPLAKPKRVRASDWSKKLSPKQTTYAASDAYAGLVLFFVLDNKRKQLPLAPPRPGSEEYNVQRTKHSSKKDDDFQYSKDPSSKQTTGTEVVAQRRFKGGSTKKIERALLDLRTEIQKNICELCPIQENRIASEPVINMLALTLPKTQDELAYIKGGNGFQNYAKQWSVDLLSFIQERAQVTVSPRKRGFRESDKSNSEHETRGERDDLQNFQDRTSSDTAFEVQKPPKRPRSVNKKVNPPMLSSQNALKVIFDGRSSPLREFSTNIAESGRVATVDLTLIPD